MIATPGATARISRAHAGPSGPGIAMSTTWGAWTHRSSTASTGCADVPTTSTRPDAPSACSKASRYGRLFATTYTRTIAHPLRRLGAVDVGGARPRRSGRHARIVDLCTPGPCPGEPVPRRADDTSSVVARTHVGGTICVA